MEAVEEFVVGLFFNIVMEDGFNDIVDDDVI